MSKLPELGDEGVPAYLIRAQAEKLAERLAELHKSIESNANDQEEIQKNIAAVHAAIADMRTFLRIISGEVKRIEKAQPGKPAGTQQHVYASLLNEGERVDE